jgi:hypothetical protein
LGKEEEAVVSNARRETTMNTRGESTGVGKKDEGDDELHI